MFAQFSCQDGCQCIGGAFKQLFEFKHVLHKAAEGLVQFHDGCEVVERQVFDDFKENFHRQDRQVTIVLHVRTDRRVIGVLIVCRVKRIHQACRIHTVHTGSRSKNVFRLKRYHIDDICDLFRSSLNSRNGGRRDDRPAYDRGRSGRKRSSGRSSRGRDSSGLGGRNRGR